LTSQAISNGQSASNAQMRAELNTDPLPMVVCFCHLRWNFVYQRPQHLMSRWSSYGDVLFVEEPIFTDTEAPRLSISQETPRLRVLTPLLPHGLGEQQIIEIQRRLLDKYLAEHGSKRFITWYYTPMALRFSSHLAPDFTVYDCMDELSAFQGAPPQMVEQERRLFEQADVVFAGGRSLYEAKRKQHGNVHLFPSSIDQPHFAKARQPQPDPVDQRAVPHPRIGFYGVLDERLDTELLGDAAAARPDWHIVLIGPVVKIQERDLPHAANIHYLGPKSYADLPQYLASWDVAILPFARNASTRFISPTKTPEYLAAGKPVVSTPIQDVVEPYEALGLVRIGSTPAEFTDAIEAALTENEAARLSRADEFMADMSWDKTFDGMRKKIFRCGSEPSSPSVLTGPKEEAQRTLANV
jgi:glycosyltransferase involved in cell wall biosynthesis